MSAASGNRLRPVALVIPWFGRDLKGGAEQQAWQVAVRLAARGNRVEVLTTCCRSFSDDWAENHLPPGESVEGGITIRRFPVNSRDRKSFDDLNRELLARPRHSLVPGVSPVDSERAGIWTRENINSTKLEEYLQANPNRYHCLIFIPYLYGITLRSVRAVGSRAWLQPCLHDEAYAYLPDVAGAFHNAKGLLFNSHGEMELAVRLFGPGVLAKGHIVGEGIETDDVDLPASDALPPELQGQDFLLCLGRRCEEKGTNSLVEAFANYKGEKGPSTLRLVLAGPGSINYADYRRHIVDLGLVTDAQKLALLKHCRALLQPSLNESFSRVLYEAWRMGRPVLVHADCLATAAAVNQSQGGWTARTQVDWLRAFADIAGRSQSELDATGARGADFARAMANWDSVMERYEDVLALHPHSALAPKTNVARAAIHQLLPNLSYGDAISNQAIWIREQLQVRGYRSEIFVRYIDQRVRDKCRVYQPGAVQSEDGLLYHHSIGSELTPSACAHTGRKWLIYHNITPPEFFMRYSAQHARLLRQGREEMWTLARSFPVSLGVSRYNAEELRLYGFSNPGVLPLAVGPSAWNEPADPSTMRRMQDGRTNLLYVGRFAPNKCQHDLISAFRAFLEVQPEARLILVGNSDASDPYCQFVERSIERERVRSKVLIAGHVTSAELQAYYRTAHLFWSMSEHEGFCIPLIEAMWFDVPILAFRAAAVTETLADCGVTFDRKGDWPLLARLAAKMVSDDVMRPKIVHMQRQRRMAFAPATVSEQLMATIA